MLTIERPRLLVPFDGSPTAEQVLRAACRAARDERAPLVVLGVVPIPAGRAADETPVEAGTTVMRALLEAQDICRQEGVAAILEETYATNLADEILRVADRMRATLIALPLGYRTRGESGLMSPTVQRVLAGARCTVLISPDGLGSSEADLDG